MKWENTTDEKVLEPARREIWQSWRRACAEHADHPRADDLFNRDRLPAFHDPFAGGGSLPLEAQRLGLMRTELAGNLKKKINALASSIVLVCRRRPADAPAATRRECVTALRAEVPPALRLLQTGNVDAGARGVGASAAAAFPADRIRPGWPRGITA